MMTIGRFCMFLGEAVISVVHYVPAGIVRKRRKEESLWT